MKYQKFSEKVEKLEQESELVEYLYLKAVKMMEDVRDDLSKLDDLIHVQRVIKPFLTNWGMMGRVVGRKNLEWEKLSQSLRDLHAEFMKLRDQRVLTCAFENPEIAESIKRIYDKLDGIDYIGSPTTVSKILHLLNTDLFVMWDDKIRKEYHKKNRYIRDSARGYLEFLQEMKKELREAFEEHQKTDGKTMEEIERELQGKYNKSMAKLVDEYNWWCVNREKAELS